MTRPAARGKPVVIRRRSTDADHDDYSSQRRNGTITFLTKVTAVLIGVVLAGSLSFAGAFVMIDRGWFETSLAETKQRAHAAEVKAEEAKELAHQAQTDVAEMKQAIANIDKNVGEMKVMLADHMRENR